MRKRPVDPAFDIREPIETLLCVNIIATLYATVVLDARLILRDMNDQPVKFLTKLYLAGEPT